MTNSIELLNNTDTLAILSGQAAEYINGRIEFLKEQLSAARRLKTSNNVYCLAESSYKRIEADFKVLIATGEWNAVKHYYDELEHAIADIPNGYINEREKNMAYDILNHVKEAAEEFTNILNLPARIEEAEISLEER